MAAAPYKGERTHCDDDQQPQEGPARDVGRGPHPAHVRLRGEEDLYRRHVLFGL